MEICRRVPKPALEMRNLPYEISLPNSKAQNLLEEIVWYQEKEVEYCGD